MTKILAISAACLFLAAGVLALTTFGVMLGRTDAPMASQIHGAVMHYEVPASANVDHLTEYELLDQSGAKFLSKSLDGHVQVVSFFFSRCPSICYVQNQAVAKLAKEYGPQGVSFLSLTCDPEYDSPMVLQRYADHLSANPAHWSFLTGDLIYIRRIGADIYRLPVESQKHSERLMLIDKWGNIRGALDFKTEMPQIKALLTQMLAETEEPDVEPLIKARPPLRAKTGLPEGEDDEPAPAPGALHPEEPTEEEPTEEEPTEEEPTEEEPTEEEPTEEEPTEEDPAQDEPPAPVRSPEA
ncbi:SCO family protein [Lignipirellula cremea]|uniref:Thioredoxin domain-containing protein n=1 Tax=Lignipirellula cremea TaxID=2528010 RepID=A0A518DYU5_9BACT|nr:SCO family protein [Lignipirellula cremea]QDU97018.1 hypothetical protein Pla8534_48430 [Lignipirellula cremea]